jgi:hypothetical protein
MIINHAHDLPSSVLNIVIITKPTSVTDISPALLLALSLPGNPSNYPYYCMANTILGLGAALPPHLPYLSS